MNDNAANNDDVKNVLQELIEIARDGQEGFSLASEHAQDPSLKAAFAERSSKRASFVRQLRLLQSNYSDAERDDSDTITGGLHRAWMTIRAAVARKEDQAILEEAERGEDAAVEAYTEALGRDPALPAEVRNCIQSQAAEVQQDHDFVRDLRDSGKFDHKTK